MRIEVGQRHIDHGKRFYCKQCPVALAIQEATGDVTWWVGGKYTWRWGHPGDPVVPLSSEVIEFIQTFDRGQDVEPFAFDLVMPSEVE